LSISNIQYYFFENKKFFNATPFLKFLAPYCIGIVLYKCLGFTDSPLLLYVIISTSILSSFQLKNQAYLIKKQVSIKVLFIYIFLLSAGYLLAFTNDPIHIPDDLAHCSEQITFFKGEVVRKWKSGNKNRHVISIESGLKDGKWLKKQGKIVLITNHETELEPGHYYLVKNKSHPMKSSENSYNIEFFNFYKNQGIFLQQYLQKGDFVALPQESRFSLVRFGYETNNYFEGILKKRLDSLTFSVANALILGDKDDLSGETVMKFRHGGIMHILAVSGLHVGIIFLILQIFFGYLRKFKYGKYFYNIIALSVLWGYAMVTGWSVSVVRATIMFSLFIGSGFFNRKNFTLNTTAFAAFCMLLYNPNNLFQVGFQLSFAAVFSILLFYDSFYLKWRPKNIILDYVWKLTCVSLAAQIGTFPLTIYYFHQFQPFFLVFNIVAIPYAAFLLFGGLMVIIIHPIDFLADILSLLLGLVTKLMYALFDFFLKFLHFINDIYINTWQVILLFLVFFFSAAFLYKKKISYYLLLTLLFGVVIAVQANTIYQRKSQSGFIVFNSAPAQIIFYAGNEYGSFDQDNNPSKSSETITRYYFLSKQLKDLPFYSSDSFQLSVVNGVKTLKIKQPRFKLPHNSYFEVIILDFHPNAKQKLYFEKHTDNLVMIP